MRTRFGLACGIAAAWAILSLSAGAWAQETTATDEQANELFDRAEAEWQARRLGAAADLLRQSLELRPRTSTAFNLAAVLHETGEIQEAMAVMDQLLDERYGPMDEARRTVVEERRARAAADLATVRIHGRGPGDGRVFLDGDLIGELRTGRDLEAVTDPGEHLVATIVSSTSERLERRIRLSRGDVTELSFLLPVASDPLTIDEAATSEDDDGLWASPFLWVAVGVVLAGTGIGLAIYYATRGEDRVVDPIFGDAETLSVEF